MAKPWKRQGHRGYLIDNASITHRVTIIKSRLCTHLLEKFPDRMVWPSYGDLEGAKSLIDAVLDENESALASLVARFPEYDLGIDAFRKAIARRSTRPGKRVQTIKRMEYPGGLAVELTVERGASETTLAAIVLRGAQIIARKTLVKRKKATHGTPQEPALA